MEASASCSVTRPCTGAPSIACSGNTCSSGPGGTGWVQCDSSPQTYCPDCSLNGVCNPACYAGADLDCNPCGSDGYCNPACGLAQDIDCCPQGEYCKYNSQCGPWGVCNNRACICV
jgi:hypothetical protein